MTSPVNPSIVDEITKNLRNAPSSLHLIVGPIGSGKSTVIAEAVERARVRREGEGDEAAPTMAHHDCRLFLSDAMIRTVVVEEMKRWIRRYVSWYWETMGGDEGDGDGEEEDESHALLAVEEVMDGVPRGSALAGWPKLARLLVESGRAVWSVELPLLTLHLDHVEVVLRSFERQSYALADEIASSAAPSVCVVGESRVVRLSAQLEKRLRSRAAVAVVVVVPDRVALAAWLREQVLLACPRLSADTVTTVLSDETINDVLLFDSHSLHRLRYVVTVLAATRGDTVTSLTAADLTACLPDGPTTDSLLATLSPLTWFVLLLLRREHSVNAWRDEYTIARLRGEAAYASSHVDGLEVFSACTHADYSAAVDTLLSLGLAVLLYTPPGSLLTPALERVNVVLGTDPARIDTYLATHRSTLLTPFPTFLRWTVRR
jgi:hypothetical protein